MKYHLLAIAILFALTSDFTAATEVSNESTDDAETLRSSLATSYEQCIEVLTFKSSFRYYDLSTDLPYHDGQQAEINQLPQAVRNLLTAVPPTATGLFVKEGPTVRYKLDYGEEPSLVEGASPAGRKTTSRFTHVSFDEVADSEAQSAYRLPQSDTKSVLDVLRYEKFTNGTPETFFGRLDLAADVLHPLNLLSNHRGKPYELWDFHDAQIGQSTSIEDSEDTHINLLLKRDNTNSPQSRWISTSTQYGLPLIRSIRMKHFRHTGEWYIDKLIFCEDYFECLGGKVPRTIIAMTYRPEGAVRVCAWLSDDLGLTQPHESDFTQTVNENTNFFGVKILPKSEQGRRIVNLKELAKQEVWDSLPQEEALVPVKADTNQTVSWRNSFLAVNIVVIVSLLISFLFMKK